MIAMTIATGTLDSLVRDPVPLLGCEKAAIGEAEQDEREDRDHDEPARHRGWLVTGAATGPGTSNRTGGHRATFKRSRGGAAGAPAGSRG
jgi:hypothetical protein